jgi:hypothetical protein
MSNNYLLRVGNGNNFMNSVPLSIWACKSKYKTFLSNVKEGDKLWFIRNKQKGSPHNGKVIAVADFVCKNKRETGPLVSITPDNEELGWDQVGDTCDIEIHYTNLYLLNECNLYTGQNGQSAVVEYEHIKEKCLVNLCVEYEYIVKYCNVVKDNA